MLNVKNNNISFLLIYFKSTERSPQEKWVLSPVAQGNFSPGPHRSGRDSLPSSGSYRPVGFYNKLALPPGSSHHWLTKKRVRTDNPTLSLHPFYRDRIVKNILFSTHFEWNSRYFNHLSPLNDSISVLPPFPA